MANQRTIAVIDDHPIVRRGLTVTFDEEKDFRVVAEGASAVDAVRIARDKNPDVYLLDVTMPGNGVEAAREIKAMHPNATIIMFTIREELATVQAALTAGATGYVLKGIDADELVSVVRSVVGGSRYVSPELAAKLLGPASGTSDADRPAADATRLASLTERERQIFEQLGSGRSNREIAGQLGLTENTIKHYITPLLQKLGVRNRTEAALLAKSTR